ncbi:glycosyltransferase [Caulobacter sp. 17J65-9]|uniref:glycosyltransferase n=1 Tax=Caulobacter sp. 17J65-9 TaxID=2709382 RepID=UPI0013CD4E22|nr:glycosyltransferase [Caulobacter sp. 17J65-9]NEX91842.1 glycosyltransferase [Caulobacter sp. 17J65-9]
MRVANVMLSRGQGGLEAMARRYHDALSETGDLVLSIGRRNSWFSTQFPGGGFQPAGGRFGGDFGVAAGLGHVLRRFAPDVVLVHGVRAFRLARSPLVWPRPKIAFVAHNFRFKDEMAEADLLIAASEPVASGICEQFPDTPLTLVENFGRLWFAPVRAEPKTPVRIGALGRLHPSKGFDVLIEAAALLKQRGVNFVLDIAGEGDLRRELEARTAALDLEGVVRFPGWTDNPSAFLGGLDLFVLSSRMESFGLVLIEAMAAGVPVVSTDIEGPGQILGGKDMARLVPSEDPERLAQAIQAALADWPESRRRAELAQVEARERFGFEIGALRLSRALQGFTPEKAA